MQLKEVLFSIAFLSICLYTFPQETNQFQANIRLLLEQANEKCLQKKFIQAIKDCEIAELLCPNCTAPHYQKMIIYADSGDIKNAEKELKKAYKLNHFSNDYSKYSIILKLKQKLTKEAYTDLQKLIDADSLGTNAIYWYTFRATLHTQNKNYTEAYKDNKKIFSLNPYNLFALSSMINHELYINDTVTANEHILSFTLNKYFNDSFKIYSDRGYFYYKLKKYNKALSYFDSALLLSPKNIKGIIGKALVFASLTNYSAAINLANQALKLKPNNASLLNNRGFIYILCNYYDSAISDLKKSIAISQEDAMPYNNLAYIYYKIGGEENISKSKELQIKAKEVGGSEYIPYWKILTY